MNIDREIERIAEQYRSEGYSVLTHPDSGQLPPFAVPFAVDILASKGQERVIVGVKESRRELHADPGVGRMAEVINSQPGWRFDLIVLNPDSASGGLPDGAREPSADKILADLDFAEENARGGDHLPAFLVAWPALEASLRHAGRGAGVDVADRTPTSLVGALYSGGVLEREEFDKLNVAIKIRNATVHGLEVPRVDPSVISFLVALGRKLLSGHVAENSV